MLKVCSKCGKRKSIFDYDFSNKKLNKRRAECKECRISQSKKNYNERIAKPGYQKQIHDKLNKLGSGCYGVYHKRVKIGPIYIGESDKIYARKTRHFSKWKDGIIKKDQSPIQILLTLGKIKKEELSFKILKEMANSTKKERLDEEDKLIEKWNKGQLLNKQKKPPLLFGIVN